MSQAHESFPNQGLLPAQEVTKEAQELAESSFDVLPPFPQVFSFRGRIDRGTYTLIQILFILTALIVYLTADGILSYGWQEILTIATPLVHSHAHPNLVNLFDSIGGGDPIRLVIGIGCFLAFYILNLSATVRRFHDFDYSGWSMIPLNLVAQIPYIGWIFVFVPFGIPGTDGPNRFGDRPKPAYFWARLRQMPRHLWRGETPLINMLFFYVLFLDFLVADKAGTTLMASLDLSTVNLLFVGALIMLNCVLSVGLWRSATISNKGTAWRFLGKLIAVILVGRVLLTLSSLVIAGRTGLA